jgi:hypothetical protein
MEPINNSLDDQKKALTSIHGTYTLSNTREEIADLNEQTMKNFLNTPAEIALAIAARKIKR